MKRLKGVVIPLVTPLTGDDKIDVRSLERLTDYCIDGGMTALYPCGTTGEMMYLTVEERKKVAETVVGQAAGRVPVFVHAGAWNQTDTIALARHAAEIGADGIGVVTPSFYKISDRGLIDFFCAVAGSVPEDFPVYLYGIKQNAVNDITPYVCEQVAALCPNVIGVKYSYPDMVRLQDLMAVKNGTFDVLVGPDDLFTAVCTMGGKGVISGNATIIREHYKAAWDALEDGNYVLAARVQHRINQLNHILCEVNNIAAYKVMLQEAGILEETCMRKPMEKLTASQEQDLIRKLEQMHYKQVLVEQ